MSRKNNDHSAAAVKGRRYAHSKTRAKERYDFNLTFADFKRIIKLIQEERTRPIGSFSNTKKVHLVHYNRQDIAVLYCNKTKAIVTILPKEHFLYHKYRKESEPDMNRKQRRTINKLAGNKEASSSIDLMLGMPDCCSVCQEPYDKRNIEMARTWFVDVYKSQKIVVLTCPECRAGDADGLR